MATSKKAGTKKRTKKEEEGETSSKKAEKKARKDESASEEEVAEKEEPKPKPELKKGVSFDAVFQAYNNDELKKWCKDHEIKSSGKKNDLIKRVLAFLDGDT